MLRVYDLILKAAPMIWVLLGLSIVTMTCVLDQLWFWLQLLSSQETIVAEEILQAARQDLAAAAAIASQSQSLVSGRFLLAPLKLKHPTPETFRLALETAEDQEFLPLRRGNKLLETITLFAPLLGLLGTAIGLVQAFWQLQPSADTTANMQQILQGTGNALINTVAGITIATIALLTSRISLALQNRQMQHLASLADELTLIYQQFWQEQPSSLLETQSPHTSANDTLSELQQVD